MQGILRRIMRTAVLGALTLGTALAQNPPPAPDPPKAEDSSGPLQEREQQPVEQQDTVHPKNSKDDVQAIGNSSQDSWHRIHLGLYGRFPRMLTNDEMCMSRRSFQTTPQFMPWGAIRGCFSAARKFCVPSKALANLFGQFAVSYLVLALELFAMSRISLTGRHWRIMYSVAV